MDLPADDPLLLAAPPTALDEFVREPMPEHVIAEFRAAARLPNHLVWHVARHEAAHVVVALAYGLQVGAVRLWNTAQAPAGVTVAHDIDLGDKDAFRSYLDFAVAGFAWEGMHALAYVRDINADVTVFKHWNEVYVEDGYARSTPWQEQRSLRKALRDATRILSSRTARALVHQIAVELLDAPELTLDEDAVNTFRRAVA